MKNVTVYAITLIVGCCIVCCSAGPSGIDGDSIIGGHGEGCPCHHTNFGGFCLHAEGFTCPAAATIDKCSNSTRNPGSCWDKSGDGFPCNPFAPNCRMQNTYHEQCFGGEEEQGIVGTLYSEATDVHCVADCGSI